MKIYVAGKNISRAISVMDRLRDAGHAITYDWATDFDNAEKLDEEQTQKLAIDERIGVKDADLLVYLWESDQESARYEAGMAMGLGKPVVVVAQHDSLFFHLPEIQKVSSDEQIVSAIKRLPPQ